MEGMFVCVVQARYPCSVHADPVVWTSDDFDDPPSALVQPDHGAAARVRLHAHSRITGRL